MDALPLTALESNQQFLVVDGLVAFLLLEALGGPMGFLLLVLRLMLDGAVIMLMVLTHNLARDGGGLEARVVHFLKTKIIIIMIKRN